MKIAALKMTFLALAALALTGGFLPAASRAASYQSVIADLRGEGGDLCLDVPWGSTDDVPLIVWVCNGRDNQQWILEHVGGDSFRLRALHSGKCLTVPGGSTASGVQVVQ